MKIQKYSPTAQKKKLSLKTRIKVFFYYSYSLVNVLGVLLHRLTSKKKRNPKYEVSICLIFKNEAIFLKEWLEYHLLIGVDHFYLYNNFSDDNYEKVLEPYINRGLVTLIDWPYKYAQTKAYEDAFERFKDETHWLGYIDADEFVNIRENDIKDFLKKYTAYPGVFFNWRMFGTSGHVAKTDKLVTETFTACWENLTDVGKTFVNTDYALYKIGTAHYMPMKSCGLIVFPVGLNKFPSILFKTLSTKGIAQKGHINHYWSKTYDDYYYKDFVKGEVDNKTNEVLKMTPGRFEYHETQNSSRDYSIQRWLVLLKKQMEA